MKILVKLLNKYLLKKKIVLAVKKQTFYGLIAVI